MVAPTRNLSSSSMPSDASSCNHQKKVSFQPRVQYIETLSIYDYSPVEFAASWYDEEEMSKIATRCVWLLNRIEADGSSRNKGGKRYCIRGLESHSNIGSIAKAKNRSNATAAVLREQSQQRDQQNQDIRVQAIAETYRRTTASCQLWAHAMGKYDERIAESLHIEDEMRSGNFGVEEYSKCIAYPLTPRRSNCCHDQSPLLVEGPTDSMMSVSRKLHTEQ